MMVGVREAYFQIAHVFFFQILWRVPRLDVIDVFRFRPGDDLPCKRFMLKAVIIHALKLIEYLCRNEDSVHIALEVYSVFSIEEGVSPALA